MPWNVTEIGRTVELPIGAMAGEIEFLVEDRRWQQAAQASSRRPHVGSALRARLFFFPWRIVELPGGSAYVIGEAGLTTALYEAGYTLTDTDPDYVVLGETRTYSFEAITRAIRLVGGGARFIATNPDVTGPSPEGPLPATGSVAAMITQATGAEPYFVGKPNPMMFRSAMNRIEAHSESTIMIGDRMDTDVVAGIEAGLETDPGAVRLDRGRRRRPLPVPAEPDLRLDRRRHRPGLRPPRSQ